MSRIIHILFLELLLLSSFATGSENKLSSTTQKPTEEQKKQWEADAARYRQLVTALGGKMGDPAEKSKSYIITNPEKDQKAKL